MDVDWQADLDRWLGPFVAALGHKTRARMCPLYADVPPLYCWFDWSGRPQERSAYGGAH